MNILKNKNNIALIFILVLVFCKNCSDSTAFKDPIIDLTNNEWAIQMDDKPEYSTKNYNDSKWKTIEIPNKLRSIIKGYRGVFWLRKTVDLDIYSIQTNIALYLGKVYEKDEVFFNGVLIGSNGKNTEAGQSESAIGIERIYNIPPDLIRNGENSIAIKITSSLFHKSEIITGPIVISSPKSVVDYSIQKYYPQLILTSLFLALSILFFIYYTVSNKQEILFFAGFILLYSIYHFTDNEIRFRIYDSFLVFSYLGFFVLFIMPWFYINFVEKFLKITILKFKLAYLILCVLACAVLLFFRNPVFWDNFWSIWALHLIPLAIYSSLLLKNDYTKLNSVLLLGTNVYFVYTIFKEILLQYGILSGTSSLPYAVPVIIFATTFVIRGKNLIELILIRNKFKAINKKSQLKENIYPLLDSLLSPNLQEFRNLIEPLIQKENQAKVELEPGFVESMYFIQTEIKSDAEDTIRLTQLKLIEDLTDKQDILFIEFVKQILISFKITYTIKIDDKFRIYSNPEYIKMLIVNLLEYPAFVNFETNDLMITSDLKNKIHLRFMMFHRNIQITHNIYKEFSTNINDSSASSIKWQIVQELLRLIGGKITMNLIRKKYLWLDIQIDAFLPVEKTDKVVKPQQINLEKIKELTSKYSKIDIKAVFSKVKSKLPLKK
ncbi:MAG: hypothetical protein H7A23_03100 [Leptospiraceae bacterium]|nr:hypothetical protein [Leptospiraceae bacterium]MCP5493517.1 hypothetical protein [Leptospiraceae bacterium]